jgi:hypothetical protein
MDITIALIFTDYIILYFIMTNVLGAGGTNESISKNITIRNLGIHDEYYKRTRYDVFSEIINYLKNYEDVKSILDIGTSFGAFVYLANKNGFICNGCDIEVDDNSNDVFLEEFNRKCIFKSEFNDIYLLDNYDLISSFNLTHIFSYDAFLYLLKMLSHKSKYCILHICESHVDLITNNCDFATFIQLFSDNNGAFCIFLKFNSKPFIEKNYKFIRSQTHVITLEDFI